MALYELNARTKLRAFIRRLQKNGRYQTAMGKANIYAGQTRLSLHVKSAHGKKPISLR
ncbi:hypothetical protein RB620_24665 [Paenibacillus sp. LHD-117]|uniref:hypothetical protein n=1 Tax=Paenibacillus sp. LHD-117 TaxID=3071412 RepID=UPI0027DFCF12|nr:hypothetical protein [Paenibacillus sp. LHD-117]MDQ6422630.1 hypothetical protein [Paenibacillus sp. LHD-117]